MDNISEEFRALLAAILQDMNKARIDIAQEVYRLIINQENRSEALQYFFENAEDSQTTPEQSVSLSFSDEIQRSLKNRCNKLIDGILTKLIQQGLECKQFYDKLWDSIQNDALLDTEEEKIYALYRLWTDGRLPYFLLDNGICMDNEKFQEISTKRCKEIKKACYILEAPLQQRTEQTSLIIRVLDSCENEEERAVVLAQVLVYSERRIWNGIMRSIEDRVEQEE